MRQLTRLLRYLVPYWWQFIPSVFLLAAVGFLDAFRVLLIGPVLDRVLNPSSGSDNILLFTIPHTNRTIYLQPFVPVALSQRVDGRRLRLRCFHGVERHLRLRRNLSGELRRLWTDYRPAQFSVQFGLAPLGGVLSEAFHRDAGFDHRQRRRTRAVRHVERDGGIPAAVFYLRCSWREW